MPKFKAQTDVQPGLPDFTFFCPGCQTDHGVWTSSRNLRHNAIWQFNGDVNRPTVNPSIKVSYPYGPEKKMNICHSFIRNGMIQYLGDCTHNLAGQTIELPEIE